MKERLIHGNVSIIPDGQPTEVLQPSKRPLHRPSPLIATQFAPIVVFPFVVVLPIRTDQLDATSLQSCPKRVAVVASVGDDALRIFSRSTSAFPGHGDGLDRCFQQRHFRRGRRVQVVSERNTLAVHHHHPLRTLSAFGLSDTVTPFFAGAKLPSAKVSAQSSWPFSSNSATNARQTRSQTPSSSQSRRRRQHVLAEGYRSGRSFQRAPLRSTQRIPSKTLRLSIGLGPPFPDRLNSGKSGSIFCHCSSVSNVLSLAIQNTSIHYGQVKHNSLPKNSLFQN